MGVSERVGPRNHPQLTLRNLADLFICMLGWIGVFQKFRSVLFCKEKSLF